MKSLSIQTWIVNTSDHRRGLEEDDVLKIPLTNGNVMNIPLSSINISEEVTKSGIWKHVNRSNKPQSAEPEKEKEKVKSKEKKKNPNKSSGRFKKKKHNKKEEKREEERRNKLEKRLSTMDEEDEDDVGITIKHETWTSTDCKGVTHV